MTGFDSIVVKNACVFLTSSIKYIPYAVEVSFSFRLFPFLTILIKARAWL